METDRQEASQSCVQTLSATVRHPKQQHQEVYAASLQLEPTPQVHNNVFVGDSKHVHHL